MRTVERNDTQANDALFEGIGFLAQADALHEVGMRDMAKSSVREAIVWGNLALNKADSGKVCNEVINFLSDAVMLSDEIDGILEVW